MGGRHREGISLNEAILNSIGENATKTPSGNWQQMVIKLALGAFPLHDFVYDNNPPWPEGADARGFALELAHTSDNAVNNPLDPLGHGIPSN